MIGRAALALAALLTSSAVAPPGDDATPDRATILANVSAALGTPATAYHETEETISSNGVTTVEHEAVRGESSRNVYVSGPFHTEDGVDRGQAWHQNDNGQTILDQPDPHPPTPDVTTDTVRRIHAPIEAYVLASLNAKGYGAKVYVDPSSWQMVRAEVIEPNGTVTTTYDDVHLDHGRTFSHHSHTVNDISRTSNDVRVTAYDLDPVTDDEVAIARPLRALVTFPSASGPVTLPTQFVGGDIVVRVTINGRGLDFALDTGASGIVMDLDVAKQLGLPLYDRESAVVARRFTTARTIVPEMHVGDLVMRNVAVQLVPAGWDSSSSVKEVGLLGFDFLAELGVTLDYEHHKVTVVPDLDYAPPSDPHTIPVEVRIGDGVPLASVSINGAVGERWILDTGGAGTFLIFGYFASRHPEALRDEHHLGAQSGAAIFTGVGGDFVALPYAIANLQLATFDVTDIVGYLVITKGSYDYDSDGVIGAMFLQLFTVELDYGHSRVYLVPNAATLRQMHPLVK
jgi:predicted aspartyl protease